MEVATLSNQDRVIPRRIAGFRSAAFATLLALLVQFLLGMGVNLFVTVPTHHPGSNAGNYFSGVLHVIPWSVSTAGLGILPIHVVLGVILALGSLSLIVQAALLAHRAWLVRAVVGAIGVVGAGFNGASFLMYNHDFSSMIMSAGFAVAIAAYAILCYSVPRPAR